MSDINAKADDHVEFIGLCQAIGYVVIHWAHIERQVDNWINFTFHNCGGKSLKSDIPKSLKGKVSFLKACFSKLAPLKDIGPHGISIIERVSRLSDQRHKLVHGAITSLVPANGSFVFQRMRIGYEKSDHTFSLGDFPSLEADLSNLVTDAVSFSSILLDLRADPGRR
jgi:hypothetical protein